MNPTNPYDTIQQLREQVAAQAAVIERMRLSIEDHLNPCGCWAGCEFCNGKLPLEQALAITTDSTQILDDVRRAERERCAKVCEDRSEHYHGCYMGGEATGASSCAAAIRAMG